MNSPGLQETYRSNGHAPKETFVRIDAAEHAAKSAEIPVRVIPDLFYSHKQPADQSAPFKGLGAFLAIAGAVLLLFVMPFSYSIRGTARVQPEQDVVVESLVNGELLELYAKEGDTVSKGQKIGMIYDRTNDQDLLSAQSGRKVLKQEIRKLEKRAEYSGREAQTSFDLYMKDAVTASEKDRSDFEHQDLMRELKIKKTKLASLETQIHYLETLKNIGTVKAPLDGVLLTKISHKLGTYFMKGDEICRIADMNQVQLAMPVYEQQLWRVKEGVPVKIKFFSEPNKIFKGRVTGIKPSAYEKTEKVWLKESVVDVLIEMNGQLPFALRAGSTAKVSIQGSGESLLTKLKNKFWL